MEFSCYVKQWHCTGIHTYFKTCSGTLQSVSANTGKMPCEYGPVFAPYLHDWTLYGKNTVQKRVRIYMAFFLCNNSSNNSAQGQSQQSGWSGFGMTTFY